MLDVCFYFIKNFLKDWQEKENEKKNPLCIYVIHFKNHLKSEGKKANLCIYVIYFKNHLRSGEERHYVD